MIWLLGGSGLFMARVALMPVLPKRLQSRFHPPPTRPADRNTLPRLASKDKNSTVTGALVADNAAEVDDVTSVDTVKGARIKLLFRFTDGKRAEEFSAAIIKTRVMSVRVNGIYVQHTDFGLLAVPLDRQHSLAKWLTGPDRLSRRLQSGCGFDADSHNGFR